jgi:hypothetical protein
MKAWSIIWGIVAAAGVIAILFGHTHHCVTAFVAGAMSFAMWPEDEEYTNNKGHHGRQ